MKDFVCNPLPREFYLRKNVVQIAKELLGKVIYTSFNNEVSAGIIVETEAYAGAIDKASHAYNNRRTARTEIMYHEGGSAYVYLCYGIHSLFNIVTSVSDDPQAVLIRGIEPFLGIDAMKMRTGKDIIYKKHGTGPGKLTKLLGIKVAHSGLDLCSELFSDSKIWIQNEGIKVLTKDIIISRRIGIEYANEDALLPYRFEWTQKKKAL